MFLAEFGWKFGPEDVLIILLLFGNQKFLNLPGQMRLRLHTEFIYDMKTLLLRLIYVLRHQALGVCTFYLRTAVVCRNFGSLATSVLVFKPALTLHTCQKKEKNSRHLIFANLGYFNLNLVLLMSFIILCIKILINYQFCKIGLVPIIIEILYFFSGVQWSILPNYPGSFLFYVPILCIRY